MRGKVHIAADLAMVVVTLLWGSTFILVKDAVGQVPVFPFLAYRFAIGTIAISAISWCMPGLRGKGISKETFTAGVKLGIFLFAGYVFQTYGLLYTSASKAGFITGLNVVLVPIGAALVLGVKPGKWNVAGALMSSVGMAALSLKGVEAPTRGDVLVLVCAFAFAMQVVLVSKYSREYDALRLCGVQMGVTCILSAIFGLAVDGASSFTIAQSSVWGALVFLGLAATAGAFLLQTVAQRYTTAARAALIFALEPVFAALFGWLLAGESLTLAQWVGGGLILAGILASELGPEKERSVVIKEAA